MYSFMGIGSWIYGWKIETTWHIAIAASWFWYHAQIVFHIRRGWEAIPLDPVLSLVIVMTDMISFRDIKLYGWWADWSLEVLFYSMTKWGHDARSLASGGYHFYDKVQSSACTPTSTQPKVMMINITLGKSYEMYFISWPDLFHCPPSLISLPFHSCLAFNFIP